ncbi:CVNH domain-containing protein [Aquibium sp. ELW1220]|jgi:hypothetical protein|uniref:mannose-binding lectin n=1 Tax=Aquibium sp. ELW1220 TaxID=2976766 RepID=UPI0025B06DA2|nr:CVNH domain-containing protein [Aquibium sp. ELW1220]MDN2581790.1 CVNH domain-containing protein [Aquibium sp. ELW1220]
MRLIPASFCLLLLGAAASHAAPSSFQRSCEDVQIEVAGGEVYLVAQCRDRAGRYRPAELRLYGYQNDDGYLVRNGYGKSSFQRSCDQYWLDVGRTSVFLNGNCRTRNGRFRESRIELQDISNDDGRLVGN